MIEQIGPCWFHSLTAQLRAERHTMMSESARLTLQLLTTAVVVLYFRNGYIPGLLNRLGGEWAWMGAGAGAAAVMWSTVTTIQCLRESTRGLRAADQPSDEHHEGEHSEHEHGDSPLCRSRGWARPRCSTGAP
jgi:hypothetical protein